MSDTVGRTFDGTDESDHGVIDLAIGAAAITVELLSQIARRIGARGYPIVRFLAEPPFLAYGLRPARIVDYLIERGRRERAARAKDVQRLLEALVPNIVDAILDQIDLTSLVRKRVDLDTLVAQVDIDAIADRLDLDAVASHLDMRAIIDRIDLVSIAEEVIDGIDLPEVIRQSTGPMASELVRGVRMQGIQADQALTGLANRLFRRRQRDDEGRADNRRDHEEHGDTDGGGE